MLYIIKCLKIYSFFIFSVSFINSGSCCELELSKIKIKNFKNITSSFSESASHDGRSYDEIREFGFIFDNSEFKSCIKVFQGVSSDDSPFDENCYVIVFKSKIYKKQVDDIDVYGEEAKKNVNIRTYSRKDGELYFCFIRDGVAFQITKLEATYNKQNDFEIAVS